MLEMSFPPLASAECGFAGEFGLDPTMYGTEMNPKISWWEINDGGEFVAPDMGFLPRT